MWEVRLARWRDRLWWVLGRAWRKGGLARRLQGWLRGRVGEGGRPWWGGLPLRPKVVGVLFALAAVAALRWGPIPVAAVASRSMEPTLRMGDLVLARRVEAAALAPGDVVLFRPTRHARERFRYPGLVVHRIVETAPGPDGAPTFRTQGDNASGPDPFTVSGEDVVGGVGLTVPYAGWPLLFLHSPQGLVFLLALGGALGAARLGQAAARWRLTPGDLAQRAVARVLERSPLTTRQERVEVALTALAQAVETYARHLESHTAVVQRLERATARLEETLGVLAELARQARERGE